MPLCPHPQSSSLRGLASPDHPSIVSPKYLLPTAYALTPDKHDLCPPSPAPNLSFQKLSVVDQEKVDKFMIELDGTENKCEWKAWGRDGMWQRGEGPRAGGLVRITSASHDLGHTVAGWICTHSTGISWCLPTARPEADTFPWGGGFWGRPLLAHPSCPVFWPSDASWGDPKPWGRSPHPFFVLASSSQVWGQCHPGRLPGRVQGWRGGEGGPSLPAHCRPGREPRLGPPGSCECSCPRPMPQ